MYSSKWNLPGRMIHAHVSSFSKEGRWQGGTICENSGDVSQHGTKQKPDKLDFKRPASENETKLPTGKVKDATGSAEPSS